MKYIFKKEAELGLLKSCRGLGIYTYVTRYADWIEKKIKALVPQYSWPPSSFAGIANPVPISPPSETVAFSAENIGRAQLLVEPCGTAVSSRIESGNNAEPEAAACMAAVYSSRALKFGGTVIHRRYVLTSARCASVYFDLFVKLGAYDMRYPTMEFSVTQKIKHDKFYWEIDINDIGLLQLSGDISFSRSVYPICIILNPEVKSKENFDTVDAYGWGRNNDLLQKVTLDRYDNRVCRNFLRLRLISGQICAGASVGETFHTVAGGPLTKKVLVNGLQRQTQFGVISEDGSNVGVTGIYTDVTSNVDWIVRNVDIEN